MKIIYHLSLFILLVTILNIGCQKSSFSVEKTTEAVEQINRDNSSCQSPLSNYNFGMIHNQVLSQVVGNNTIVSYKGYISGLSDAARVALINKIIDSTVVKFNGINLSIANRDSLLALINQHRLTFPNLDAGYPTVSQLMAGGCSQSVANIMQSMIAIIDNSNGNVSELSTALNNLRSATASLGEEECVHVNATIDVAIASFSFWSNINSFSGNAEDRDDKKKHAAIADAIGFCWGFYDGVKAGAVFGGGIPGAIAGGLLMGAIHSIIDSAVTYWAS